MMLTILHDTTFKNGLKVEVASAEGAMVSAPSGAMCQLAAALIESGYPADLPVRVVRADPWLCGPPYHVTSVSLRTVAAIDFFADDEGAYGGDDHPPRVTRERPSAVR
jgi:hypothetical protein